MKKAYAASTGSMPKIAVDEDYQITLWKTKSGFPLTFGSFRRTESSLFDGGLEPQFRHCFCDLTSA